MTVRPICRQPTLSRLRRSRVTVFDLDGTLYDDACYYAAADRSIACHIALTASLPLGDVATALSRAQERDGRIGYLDRTCQALQLPSAAIPDLLRILRTVDVRLRLYPWIEPLLADLVAHGTARYVLTNGNRQQQENKIRCLGLEAVTPLRIVFAADHRPKPDPAGLRYILDAEKADAGEVVFVGNDRTDELCAQSCDVNYICVNELEPGFLEKD